MTTLRLRQRWGRGRGNDPLPLHPIPKAKPGRLHKSLDTPATRKPSQILTGRLPSLRLFSTLLAIALTDRVASVIEDLTHRGPCRPVNRVIPLWSTLQGSADVSEPVRGADKLPRRNPAMEITSRWPAMSSEINRMQGPSQWQLAAKIGNVIMIATLANPKRWPVLAG
jgi:hypothetical protein